MKSSLVVPYVRSGDEGRELRYSLRTIKNITNFNGSVTIIGDYEKWFSDEINFISCRRRFGKPYYDQTLKMARVCYMDSCPEYFISGQDDIYITAKTAVRAYVKGELTGGDENHYRRTKKLTAEFLKRQGIAEPLDFEVHRPLLVNRDNLKETCKLIMDQDTPFNLQWRSVYGNMWGVDYELVEDNKARQGKLRDGLFISSQHFMPELAEMFAEPSIYEKPII